MWNCDTEYAFISAASVSDCSFPLSLSDFVSIVSCLFPPSFLFPFISDQRNKVIVFNLIYHFFHPPFPQITVMVKLAASSLPLLPTPAMFSSSSFSFYAPSFHLAFFPTISAIPVFIHSSHTQLALYCFPLCLLSVSLHLLLLNGPLICSHNEMLLSDDPSPSAGANNQSCFISSMTPNPSETRSKQKAKERVHHLHQRWTIIK